MRIAILDPAAGISGDMTLGALLYLGVPVSWLEELPQRLGLDDIGVTVRDVRRAGITCRSRSARDGSRRRTDNFRFLRRRQRSCWRDWRSPRRAPWLAKQRRPQARRYCGYCRAACLRSVGAW